MKAKVPASLAIMICWQMLTASPAEARNLTLEDRVKAQEAIARVYYSHQIGATRRFEESVPREVLEKKVRTYLKQSLALERFWNTRITADMLRAEAERIARDTRMPERLEELYDSLGNDAFLFQETVARAALVDRLSRDHFAFDRRLHSVARREADALHNALSARLLDPNSPDPHRRLLDIIMAERDISAGDDNSSGDRTRLSNASVLKLTSDKFNELRHLLPNEVGQVGPVSEGPETFTIQVVLDDAPQRIRLASFTVAKLSWEAWWSELAGSLDEALVRSAASEGTILPRPAEGMDWSTESGAGLQLADFARTPATDTSCTDDTWDNGLFDGAPLPRRSHTSIWTGSVMVVWGGLGSSGFLNSGSRYDPTIDRWSTTSTTNAPAGRLSHTAIWTGSLMVVWGGENSSGRLNSGGRYDPANDAWLPSSLANAPLPRSLHSAVWTGSQMVVWGGYNNSPFSVFSNGGRYDPVGDTWTTVSSLNTPAGRFWHSAVWTGNVMLIWGGYTGSAFFDTGGRYDPSTDTWTMLATASAPVARYGHTAVWTGNLMIVWGGFTSNPTALGTGGRYDPVADTWASTSLSTPPDDRNGHSAVWTGQLMIIWGGQDRNNAPLNSGGRYDPSTDSWSTTSTIGAPSGRYEHGAVWTGSLMIIWGGYGAGGNTLNSGGRYDATVDGWTATSPIDGPTNRYRHTAIWTGSLMVVWGGSDESSYVNTGGRYDPILDTWSATSMINAPSARYDHTAVWTGSQMIIWGGQGPLPTFPNFIALNNGARYDPVADTWNATSLVNAPAARAKATAVWTGSRMIVWGGANSTPFFNSGGRYDPVADTWAPTSLASGLVGRYGHTAVWTGSRMMILGGYDGTSYLNSGSRYDPVTDTWAPISTSNAPATRFLHTAVWTGRVMVVWGGYVFGDLGNTGGRYDPSTDTWSLTSTVNAPMGRYYHTATWTGNQMVIWGGFNNSLSSSVNTGGRYDPITDTWSVTSTTQAPWARSQHTAIWTGNFMIIWGGGTIPYSTGGRYCACSGTSTIYYQDADDDGRGDANYSIASCAPPVGFAALGDDCNDSAAGLWGTPTEVLDLRLADMMTPTWSPPASPGATLVMYDLLRATSPGNFIFGSTCVASNVLNTTSSDSSTPASGHASYYLVRAENGCPNGQGPLGTDSTGAVRIGRSCP